MWREFIFEKDANSKRHLVMPHLRMGKTYSNLRIMKLKVILPKPIHMNRHHWNNPHATRGKVLETKEPLHISTGFRFEKINSIRNLKTKNMERIRTR